MRSRAIRNFSVIAHIDHGKSTLADRMLEKTATIEARKMREQILDQMELERERGITIKLQPVRMRYHSPASKKEYILNLIDTPGHVDFSYEVSRSLAACEGAVLLVDATQGVQAQTLAHLQVAQTLGLKIIPVVNKIDLANAQPEKTALEIIDLLGCAQQEIIFASAKSGEGIDDLLEAVAKRIPPPPGDSKSPLRALIFDSVYDAHLGVIAYVKIAEGALARHQKIELYHSASKTLAQELGVFLPQRTPVKQLIAGEIGYIATGLKSVSQARVGDTIILERQSKDSRIEPLSGYKKITPLVWASVYTNPSSDAPLLKQALEKLRLNDAALVFEPDSSTTLGSGFRIGALGSLHLEIIRERLEREFDLDLTITSPSVKYKVLLKNKKKLEIKNPSELPDPSLVAQIKEPIMKGEFFLPARFLGATQKLLRSHRARLEKINWVDEKMVRLSYKIPLAEAVGGLYDNFKSATSGFGSFSLKEDSFLVAELVRLDILVAGKLMPEFSQIVPKEKMEKIGRRRVKKIKELIPRQLFEIKVQAAHGSHIFASARIPPLRKDVTAKLYGGDVTRKRKLLEKQKKGKRRMRQVGNLKIPRDIFFKLYH